MGALLNPRQPREQLQACPGTACKGRSEAQAPPRTWPGSSPPAPLPLPAKGGGPAASACPELRASVRTPGPSAPTGPAGCTSPPRAPPAPAAHVPPPFRELPTAPPHPRARLHPGVHSRGRSRGARSSTANPAGARLTRSRGSAARSRGALRGRSTPGACSGLADSGAQLSSARLGPPTAARGILGAVVRRREQTASSPRGSLGVVVCSRRGCVTWVLCLSSDGWES